MTCYLGREGTTRLNSTIRDNIKPEWLDDEIIRAALLEIEHVYKVEGLAMYSSDFGVKSPESLSNGMKALLLLKYLPNDTWMYKQGVYISNCCIGDNVVPFLQRLSLVCDFPISYDIWLPIRRDIEIRAKDYDSGTILNSADELQDFYAGRYIW